MNLKQEMEKRYTKEDAWGVNNFGKRKRNEMVLSLLAPFPRFKTGLDLCCGEGTITHQLPCDTLIGIDISETAIGRARNKYPHIKWFAKNIQDVVMEEFPSGLVCWLDSSIYFTLREKQDLIKRVSEHSSVLLYSARLVGKKFTNYKEGCEFGSIFEIDDLLSEYFPHIRSKVVELDFFTYRGHAIRAHIKKCAFSAVLLLLTKFSKDKYVCRCNIVNRLSRIPILKSFALPLIQQYAVVGFH